MSARILNIDDDEMMCQFVSATPKPVQRRASLRRSKAFSPESRGTIPIGVAAVTTRDAQRRPCGLTATSACLVSWQSPRLLVCIENAAECHVASVLAGDARAGGVSGAS